MARRPRWGVVPRVFGLGVVVGMLAGGAPAAADTAGIPGYNGSPGAGQWIAFQFDSRSIPYNGTVTLSLVNGSAVPDASAIWGPQGNWPETWNAGGLTLKLTTPPCAVATHLRTSCPFTVENPGTYQNVLFEVGMTPDQVLQYQQTISRDPPPTTPTTQQPPPDATFSGPPNSVLSPGQFQFKAPGQPGVNYAWKLSFNNSPIDQQSGPTYTPPASIFQTPGQYTLTLIAEDQNTGRSTQSSASFQVLPPSNPTPTPQPAPTARPPAAQPTAPAAPISQVAFTPRLAEFATPKPGAVQPVTVIWLWRPDWFQSAAGQVKTRGRPTGIRRAAVSVNANRGGPSATPWLAGLATFGIFGAAWLAVRRRRVRTSILD